MNKVIFDEFTDTWLFGIICGVVITSCIFLICGCDSLWKKVADIWWR